ncbi:MAG: hypothetical protein JST89_00400 [Cyanobacteria bacterium SZAS-4]|nr:hypothetical protein [Cyanobacteria bacterium SZAS-4]
MNCDLKDEKFGVNNLTLGQKAALKPALTFLQIGASFYLSELIKPILLPVLILSLTVVLLVVLRARKQPEVAGAHNTPPQMLVAVQAESTSFSRTNEFIRN